MNVISFKRIRDFTAIHQDAATSLKAWYTVVKKANWLTHREYDLGRWKE